MAGLLPNEGETFLANLLFKSITTDRGTNLDIGLFTNSSIDETITAATLTEPSGGGYARKTLTDASWTVSADLASYAAQVFTVTTTPYTGTVKGYFIVTKGTTPRIIAIEVNSLGPHTLLVGDTYTVTPNITVA